jgi:hypothetical protein
MVFKTPEEFGNTPHMALMLLFFAEHGVYCSFLVVAVYFRIKSGFFSERYLLQLSPARWDAVGIQNLRHGDFAAPFTTLLHLRQFLWGEWLWTSVPRRFSSRPNHECFWDLHRADFGCSLVLSSGISCQPWEDFEAAS